jgi:hypothetical protein
VENILRELDIVTEFVKSTWTSVVMPGMGTPPGAPELRFDSINTRREYADSITIGSNLDVPEAGFFNRSVIATAKIAEETERGKPRWDMKPMLLGGPKTRLSKKGIKYNIIPFRHGVPGGSVNSHFKTMPRDIYAAARQLKPTMSKKIALDLFGTEHYSKIVKYGESLNSQQHALLLAKHSGHPRHKSISIYEGMYRVQATYGKATQSQYLTFRMVSENSSPDSWWHPGRAAQPHVQWVIDFCRPKIEARLRKAATLDLADLATFQVGMTVTVTP